MDAPITIPVQDWLEEQARHGWRAFQPGDGMLSFYLGGIGYAIGALQGRPGPTLKSPPWSHAALYVGAGNLAEATAPRGGVRPVAKYATPSRLPVPRWPHVVTWYRVPHWTLQQRMAVASAASRHAPQRYDFTALAAHALDNLVERLTWSPAKQQGFRPLSRWVGDVDGARRLDCSELVQRSILEGTGEEVDPTNRPGTARPLDVDLYYRRVQAVPVVTFQGGMAVEFPAARWWILR